MYLDTGMHVCKFSCLFTFQFYVSLQDDKHPIVHRDYRLVGGGDKKDDKGAGSSKRKEKGKSGCKQNVERDGSAKEEDKHRRSYANVAQKTGKSIVVGGLKE